MNTIRLVAIVICLLFLLKGAEQLDLRVARAEDTGSAAVASHMPSSVSQEALDTRTPLPLTAMMAEHQKRNMREHLLAVQEIVAALSGDDMASVEKAARRIGYSDSMAQMCQHMGAGVSGFTDMALAFHRTADTIADAAQHGDRKAVLGALGTTLEACVGCHATYRQEVVDETTWQRLTTQPAQTK